MKLFLAPGTCSLSPHIVLREAGLAFDAVKVDLGTKKTADGADYLAISPNGYVPALQLDDGTVLTEGPAIVQYLADQVPTAALAPANGTLARYQLQSVLNFISTEIHKTYSPLFANTTPQETRDSTMKRLAQRYAIVDKMLEGKEFLTGAQFTVADAYLFAVTGWARFVQFDLSPYPNVDAFMARVKTRPAVTAALEAEKALRTQLN